MAVKLRYVSNIRGNLFWRPTRRMREFGFRAEPLGPEGPQALARAYELIAEWDAASAVRRCTDRNSEGSSPRSVACTSCAERAVSEDRPPKVNEPVSDEEPLFEIRSLPGDASRVRLILRQNAPIRIVLEIVEVLRANGVL
jgi:hypothetical protein